MNGPSVDYGPHHAPLPEATLLLGVSVDGVEATAGGGAGVVRVLGEGNRSLDTITARVCVRVCVCVCMCVCVCVCVCMHVV